jgi:hypothetical protein
MQRKNSIYLEYMLKFGIWAPSTHFFLNKIARFFLPVSHKDDHFTKKICYKLDEKSKISNFGIWHLLAPFG